MLVAYTGILAAEKFNYFFAIGSGLCTGGELDVLSLYSSLRILVQVAQTSLNGRSREQTTTDPLCVIPLALEDL